MSTTSDPAPCPEALALVQRLQDLHVRIATAAANPPYPMLSTPLHELANHVEWVVADASQQATRLILQNERLSRPVISDKVRSEAEMIWKSHDDLPNGAGVRELRRYANQLKKKMVDTPDAFHQIVVDFQALCEEVIDACGPFHALIRENKRLRRKHEKHELWEAKTRLKQRLDNGEFTKDPNAQQPMSECVGEMSERLDNITIIGK